MRVALLPTPGDPFMLAYWLRNYETWRQYVDRLIVFANGPLSTEARAYDKQLVEGIGGQFMYTTQRQGHDGAIRELLWEVDGIADCTVVLLEDDAYVRHPHAVDNAFVDIETGGADIVGSPRHEDYFTSPVYDWDGDPYTPGDLAELRHGLWPAFLFTRPEYLLATDQNFGDRAWRVGETITGWGEVTPEACQYVGVDPFYVHLDTLFGTTFQLRAAGLETSLVHHVRLYDAPAVESWLAEDPPWFHVTGLSTLDYIVNDRDDVTELALWPRRIAWFRIILTSMAGAHMETAQRDHAIQDFIRRWDIDRHELAAWHERFQPWLAKAWNA